MRHILHRVVAIVTEKKQRVIKKKKQTIDITR